ncbi:ubiquitin-specific protease doa4 [Microbotryomycetes sp. JL201]|nr:ubiquitin-specific protease doa4 [Microbotryomycetes sp. JL201]
MPVDEATNLSDAQLVSPDVISSQERSDPPHRQPSIFRDRGTGQTHEPRPRFEPLVNLLADDHSPSGVHSNAGIQHDVDHNLTSDVEGRDLDRSRLVESSRPPSYHSPISPEHAPAGLANLGNTCYLAAVMQALRVIEEVEHLLPRGDYKNYLEAKLTKGPLCKATARLMRAMSTNVDAAVAPSAFHKTFCAIRPDFNSNGQFDAQEYLTVLLETLHDELNQSVDPSRPVPRSVQDQQALETWPESVAAQAEWSRYLESNDSPIADLFTGQFRSRVKCQSCGTTSTTFDVYQTLSLPMTEHDRGPIELAECFNALLEAEMLEGGDAWYVASDRGCLLELKLLQVLRFSSSDFASSSLETLTKPIDVSVTEKLDLSDVLPKPASDFSNRINSSPNDELMSASRGNAEFELCAIVKHKAEGQAQEQSAFGHYTAVIKTEGEWFEADDDYVTPVDVDYVKHYSKGAYLLFYRWIPR